MFRLVLMLCLLVPTLAHAQGDWRDNLVQQHNAQRGGLVALTRDARLDRAAQLHAENMARQKKLSHVLTVAAWVPESVPRACAGSELVKISRGGSERRAT